LLPHPQLTDPASLWETLRNRRSVRSFTGEPISQTELATILWAAQGITDSQGRLAFRTAPSAGALYPVETYVAVQAVQDLPTGIYYYQTLEHCLIQRSTGDAAQATASAALDQQFIIEAAVTLFWTAVFERSEFRYKERAYRYVYLDAGHIAQNAALAATALGLGSCQIGALYDDECNALLGVDGEHEGILYMTTIGHPAQGRAS
jgi:SagB-type dehydrogenase family enzyme